MPLDPVTRPSRRALLTAALGGVAATVAALTVRPERVDAADGQAVLQGSLNLPTNTTTVQTTVGTGLFGYTSASTTSASGVWGESSAVSGSVRGVTAKVASDTGKAIYAEASALNGPTVAIDAVSGSGGAGATIRAVNTNTWETAATVVYAEGRGQHNTVVHAKATSDVNTDATAVVGESAGSMGTGVAGLASNASGQGIGVWAYSASPAGYGIFGSSPGIAIRGDGQVGVLGSGVAIGVTGNVPPGSVDSIGVSGSAEHATAYGVVGQNAAGGTGVMGVSATSGTQPAAAAKTGVYGRSTIDANSRGVHGYSTAGRGVYGQATTGVAGYFSTPKPVADQPHTGTALQVVGRVKLDRCAGVATVAAGQTSASVTPGVDIVSTTAIVATIMSNVATTLSVRRVATDATANTFTIHISGAAPAGGLKVAWHLFG